MYSICVLNLASDMAIEVTESTTLSLRYEWCVEGNLRQTGSIQSSCGDPKDLWPSSVPVEQAEISSIEIKLPQVFQAV